MADRFRCCQLKWTVWSEPGSPCLSHLCRLLLPTSSTPTSPAVAGLRFVGYTRLRYRELTYWLLQYCSCRSRTVTDKLQRVLNAAARVVTGSRKFKFDRGLGRILDDELHWLHVPNRVFFKLAVTVTDVWTAAHHRTSRTTASRSLVLALGGICVPPTVNFLQYLATRSTLMAVGPSQSPAPQPGTLSQILSGTPPSVQTVSDVC